MLNPIGKAYQGYSRANQLLVEEEGENVTSEEDLEAGPTTRDQKRSSIFHNNSKSQQRRVSWDAGASEMNLLRPNIHQDDKMHEQESSDDEVPQSFMIEASRKAPVPLADRPSKGKGRIGKAQQLNAVQGRITPTTINAPRPRVNTDDARHPEPSSRQQKPMRGLDAYERALWNWVNVYSLDEFLQEVYYYYEGKGIYSIALARGLNLLLVL
jgi:autophagy-related protein 9